MTRTSRKYTTLRLLNKTETAYLFDFKQLIGKRPDLTIKRLLNLDYINISGEDLVYITKKGQAVLKMIGAIEDNKIRKPRKTSTRFMNGIR